MMYNLGRAITKAVTAGSGRTSMQVLSDVGPGNCGNVQLYDQICSRAVSENGNLSQYLLTAYKLV
jgi:hypothetical protein